MSKALNVAVCQINPTLGNFQKNIDIISKNYKKKYLPPEKFVMLLKKKFSPYCSVATWYLWRSIDPEPIQY